MEDKTPKVMLRIKAKAPKDKGFCLAKDVEVYVGDKQLAGVKSINIHPMNSDSVLMADMTVYLTEIDLEVLVECQSEVTKDNNNTR